MQLITKHTIELKVMGVIQGLLQSSPEHSPNSCKSPLEITYQNLRLLRKKCAEFRPVVIWRVVPSSHPFEPL